MFRISIVMAIIKNTTLPQDSSIAIPEAYYRIEDFYGTKNSMSIKVSTYTSKNNAIQGKELYVKSYNMIPSVENGSENFIKQGYKYLKTLPEFEGSRDDIDEELPELPIIEDMPIPPIEEGQ